MKKMGWVVLLFVALFLAACAPTGSALNTPANLTAVSGPTPSITLNWTAVPTATAYTLERKQGSENYAQLTTLSATTFTDNTVTPNTVYTYRIKATNAGSSSDWAEKSATTPTQSPANFRVVGATSSTITLSWDATPGATDYHLERADSSNLNSWTIRPLSATPPTSYTDTEIVATATYTYRLSALNTGGPSQSVSLTVSTLQPTNFAATPVSGQTGSSRTINLSWIGVYGASGYQIHRRTASAAYADLSGASNLNTVSFSDTSGATGTTYTYRIRALSGTGFGPWVESSPVTTTGTLLVPAAPTSLTATATSTTKQVTLNWAAPSPNNASSYTIERRPSASSTFAQIGTSDSTTYVDGSGDWGNSYIYRVTATNSAGNGAPSNTASATLPSAPGTPTNFTGSATSQTSISLSWTPPTTGGTATSYQLERRVYSSNDPGVIVNLTSPSYLDTGLSQNTSYSYTLTALNAVGSSNPVGLVVSTPSNTANPTGLFAKSLSSSSVRIVWQALSGATNYSVERSSDGVNFSKISTDPLTNIYFDDTSVVAPGPYTYRVKAQINGSYGSGTTLQVSLLAPGAPSGLYTTAEGEGNGSGGYTNRSWMGIRVDWDPTTTGGPVGYYEVQRLGSGGSWTRVYPEDFDGLTDAAANPPSRDYEGNLPTTLVGDSGSQSEPIQPGSTYQYRVRSVNAYGVSGWSSTSSAYLPAASAPRVAGCRSGSSNQANIGCFGSVFDWPHVATHAALLSTGQVITFHSRDADGSASNPDFNNQTLHDHTLVTIWNPATGSFTRADNPNTDLFCAGFVSGADGKFYTTGGNLGSSQANGQGYYSGSKHTDIFDPVTQTWSKGPDMADGRWYPSTITLSDGRLLTIGGNASGVPTGDRLGNYIPEIWNTLTGTLTRLTGANTNNGTFSGLGGFEHYYPWVHQAPNGYVFLSGSQMAMGYLNPAGSGGWLGITQRDNTWRTYGTSVMFRPGEVAVFGGGLPATKTVTLLQLQNSSNAIGKRSANSMFVNRTHLNGTLMADGKVFINGGNANGANYDPTPYNADTQRQSEIWTPPTAGWATRADDSSAANDGSFIKGPVAQVRRFYHSTSLLLPDASILTAGSGACGPCTGLNQLNAEVFYPPYLFDSTGAFATRPAITDAPSSISYGSSFTVTTDQANTDISRITFVKLGSVTHAFNMGQTFMDLQFVTGAGDNDLTVTAPSSGNIAPPGHYMLFTIDVNGVPSVAKIVQIQ